MLAGELLDVRRVLLHELHLDTIHHVIPELLLSPLIPAHTHTEHFTDETPHKVHQSGINSPFSRKNECVTSLQLPVSPGPAPGSSPSSWCRAQSWLPSPSPHSASAPDSSSPEPAVHNRA